MKVITINPRDCTRWKFANRSDFEFGNITTLADDIKKNGQVEPIIVRHIKHGHYKYEVIAGSRRLKACLQAEIMIKAIVHEVSDIEASIIQIKENANLDLCDYSKGMNYTRLLKNLKITQRELAEIIGCTRRKLENYLCFAKVDEEIWEAVNNMSRVSAKTAEAIYNISKKSDNHKDALIEIAEEIRNGIGCSRIEQLVNTVISGKPFLDEEEIKASDGTVFAKWRNGKIYLSKDVKFDKEKLNEHLLEFFTKYSA